MRQTPEQLAQNEEVTARVISLIEGQNWTDDPLTEGEKTAIAMAVSSILYEIRIGHLIVR